MEERKMMCQDGEGGGRAGGSSGCATSDALPVGCIEHLSYEGGGGGAGKLKEGKLSHGQSSGCALHMCTLCFLSLSSMCRCINRSAPTTESTPRRKRHNRRSI